MRGRVEGGLAGDLTEKAMQGRGEDVRAGEGRLEEWVWKQERGDGMGDATVMQRRGDGEGGMLI